MRHRPQIKECSSHNNDDLNWIAELLPVAKPYREMQKIKELREAVILAQKKKKFENQVSFCMEKHDFFLYK